jgi:hypothetical protein
LQESLTDRPTAKLSEETKINSRQSIMWGDMEDTGNTKKFIKNLLNKNKSQRRLTRFNDVRDKLKM